MIDIKFLPLVLLVALLRYCDGTLGTTKDAPSAGSSLSQNQEKEVEKTKKTKEATMSVRQQGVLPTPGAQIEKKPSGSPLVKKKQVAEKASQKPKECTSFLGYKLSDKEKKELSAPPKGKYDYKKWYNSEDTHKCSTPKEKFLMDTSRKRARAYTANCEVVEGEWEAIGGEIFHKRAQLTYRSTDKEGPGYEITFNPKDSEGTFYPFEYFDSYDAFDLGGWSWPPHKRKTFYNDPDRFFVADPFFYSRKNTPIEECRLLAAQFRLLKKYRLNVSTYFVKKITPEFNKQCKKLINVKICDDWD